MNTKNNISQEQLEAVERYINDSMEVNERLAFDQKLKEDLVFKTFFEDTKAMLLGIETAALKTELNSFHEEMDGVIQLNTGKQKKGNARFLAFSIAASIAVLLGVLWVLNADTTTNKLYAKHFTPDPGLPTTMSTTNNYDFYEAMVDYKSNKYSTAISKWELILKDKPNNDTLNYFLGVANLAEGKETVALQYLEQAAKNSNSFLRQDIHYYLGLALLKEGNIDAAKENFKKSDNEASNEILLDLNK